MAKTKEIDIQKEIKKIWDQTKKNLLKLSQETVNLVKRGEKEVVRASKIGKLQLDILGIKRKREILCRQIGMKVVALDTQDKIDVSELKPSCGQVRGLDSQIRKKEQEVAKIKKGKKLKKK